MQTLRGLREELGKTQVDVSKKSKIVQGEISVLEKREDLDGVRLGTLRRYVEALGGALEVSAVIDGARVALTVANPTDHWRVEEHEGKKRTIGHWHTRGAALRRAHALRDEGKRVSIFRLMNGDEVESYGPDDRLPPIPED